MTHHEVSPERIFEESRHLGADSQRLATRALLGGVLLLAIGLLISLLSGDTGEFARRYLVSFAFWLSLALGALFFVAIQHLTRAAWSVVVRRVAEVLAATLPVFVLLFLPIGLPVLFGDHSIYSWLDPDHVATSELLQKKAPYLDPTFFVLRWAFYFLVWISLARTFYRRSVDQDASGSPALSERMRRLSAPGLLLFGITVTFAAFDLLMSLDPEWFSTIYGVYFFAGCAVGAIATQVLVLLVLQSNGRLRNAVTIEHYHDLGKLLFGFVVFWGYIAFSQFMLIWYANIPEETIWYQHRTRGVWLGIAMVLLFGHLLVPLLGLVSRHVKRNPRTLAAWAGWLLFMHWLDLYWLVVPVFVPEGMPFHILDPITLLGIGGICVWAARRYVGGVSLVPERDPLLGRSLAFKNM